MLLAESELNVVSLAHKRTNFGAFDDVRESRASSAIIHGSRTLTQTVASLFLSHSFSLSLSLSLYFSYSIRCKTISHACAPSRDNQH